MSAKAPFIVGVSRSGTTLLRLILDAHPDLAIPPETHFIPEAVRSCASSEDPSGAFIGVVTSHVRWEDHQLDPALLRRRIASLEPFDVGDALRAFYRSYAERFRKQRWGDKTPGYIRHMEIVQEVLPESRFIHLIRDGRDVALSAFSTRMGPQTMEKQAEQWRASLQMAREQSTRLASGSYAEMYYEDLVSKPVLELKRVCELLDLKWSPAMLGYHERAGERIEELNRGLPARGRTPARSGDERTRMHALTSQPPKTDKIAAWESRMSRDEVERFEAVAGETLARHGYRTIT